MGHCGDVEECWRDSFLLSFSRVSDRINIQQRRRRLFFYFSGRQTATSTKRIL
jgi:hypothetical protein